MPKSKEDNDRLNTLIVIFLAIIIIWLASIFLLSQGFTNWSERGTFGDSFGAINSLFSGLAFGGIIYTILLQRKELKLQREELIFTREELKRTANAQEKANNFQYEQLRISNLPIFQYEAISSNDKNYLVITNGSKNAAFDLDIWLFITVYNDDNDKRAFINSHVIDSSKLSISDTLVEDDFWAIADRGIYSSFSPDHKIIIPLEYPIQIDAIEMFIQYRDSLNNNYCLKISFSSTEIYLSPMIVIGFDPKVLEITNRVDLTDDNLKKDNLPEFVQWIYELHDASIFAAQIKDNKHVGVVEAKWQMFNIRSNLPFL